MERITTQEYPTSPITSVEAPTLPPIAGQEQAPDMAIDGQYAAAASQAVAEAGEQNKQEVTLNPFLIRMFLQAHGNEQASKLFAGLLVADYASKKVIQYAEYNPQVAEAAHMQEETRRQVSESLSQKTDNDENVVYGNFGSRKTKTKKNKKQFDLAA